MDPETNKHHEDEPAEERTEDGLGILIKNKTLYHGSATTGINEFTKAEEDTIGSGIYFTSRAEDAVGYAKRRSRGKKGSSPIIYETVIENLKLVDLRQDDNAHKILEGFKLLLIKKLEQPGLDYFVKNACRNSIDAIDQNKVGAGNLKEATASHTQLFSDHIRSLGYDGLIALEGGEGEDIGQHDTYLIFDPEKAKIRKEDKIL